MNLVKFVLFFATIKENPVMKTSFDANGGRWW